MIREKVTHTSQCALDNLEVRDVAEEVRITRRIWVRWALCATVGLAVGCTIGPIGMSIRSVDRLCNGRGSRDIDGNHLVVGMNVSVGGAHF